ncbi:MAG: GNAT family N-acetyltransferase [Clostridia bacterium]|nr:GNAT family N-acetyltransferase [Clostridia bacterium]
MQIYRLYRSAFPRGERKPFLVMLDLRRKGKTDVWCFSVDKRFAGFASTINDDDLILIDYLAVRPQKRNHGIGTSALNALKAAYSGKGVFVEIESVFENTPDRQARVKRKQFYLRSGFEDMQVLADVFGIPMELLAWNYQMDFERYYGFYHDNYSPWAASHIKPMAYPQQQP